MKNKFRLEKANLSNFPVLLKINIMDTNVKEGHIKILQLMSDFFPFFL